GGRTPPRARLVHRARPVRDDRGPGPDPPRVAVPVGPGPPRVRRPAPEGPRVLDGVEHDADRGGRSARADDVVRLDPARLGGARRIMALGLGPPGPGSIRPARVGATDGAGSTAAGGRCPVA